MLRLQNQILTATHSSRQPADPASKQPPATRDAEVTASAEAALWRSWRVDHDIAARDRLVLTHAPLVKYLAGRKIRELPAHCELDDLVSCGLVALIHAVERFDPARGVAFAQYASMRISGAIIDELRRNDWASRGARATERAINRANDQAYSLTGHPATTPELARQLALTPDQLDEHLQRLNQSRLLSLNGTTGDPADEASQELIDTLPARLAGDDPEATALAADEIATIMTAIRSLPASEQKVVVLRAVHDIPNVEVGRMLGVSESRVSQIMASARRRLHERLKAQDDPPQCKAA
jgi:RNA polymerase sigma factor for flagellar operon FliA